MNVSLLQQTAIRQITLPSDVSIFAQRDIFLLSFSA